MEALDKGAVMIGLQPRFHGCRHERVTHASPCTVQVCLQIFPRRASEVHCTFLQNVLLVLSVAAALGKDGGNLWLTVCSQHELLEKA